MRRPPQKKTDGSLLLIISCEVRKQALWEKRHVHLSLSGIERLISQTALTSSLVDHTHNDCIFTHVAEVKRLQEERRTCCGSARVELSKRIQKLLRRSLRRLKSRRVGCTLERFNNLPDLHMNHQALISRVQVRTEYLRALCDFMGHLFMTDCPHFITPSH